MPGPGSRMLPRVKVKSPAKTIRRILGYMAKRKWLLACVVFFILLSSLAGIVGTYFLKPILNEGIIPLIGKSGLTFTDFIPFIQMLIIVGVVYAAGALSTFAYARIMISISNGTLNAVRRDLFNKMQDLPIQYFDSHTHGEVMSRFTSDVDTLREAIVNGFSQIISSVITVSGTFVMMLVLSPVLTLLTIGMLVIMLLVIRKIGGKSGRFFKAQQQAIGRANGYIEEMIEGQKVVKVFCREERVKEDFSRINEELRTAATHANTSANILMPIMGNLSYVNYAVTAAVGAVMAINGMLDIGSIGAFLQYTRSFSQPITMLSQQFNSILMALAGAERIFEVIDEQPEQDEGYVTLVNVSYDVQGNITESEKYTGDWAWKHPHHDGAITYTPLKGNVEFEHVTFSYDGIKTVLHDVSLHAKPGEKIALVGSTGAGKTTITNLINRFYELQSGKIRYDGINIGKIKKDDLRRSLAMVLQDTHLFTGTVAENIRYGNLYASEEEVISAARLANADSFIRHLPQKYQTQLIADGTNLSQGQCQLLSISRAAVANPPVLILDEATSSIDTRTEALIEKGMDRLMHGRTVFVIAHRLSTVRNANMILVLENGAVIEQGNHDELVGQKGRYYQLYTGQFEMS